MSDHTLFRYKLNKLACTTHSSNQITTKYSRLDPK